MGQTGLYDVANRYAGLDAKSDPLAKLDANVPWADSRPRLEQIWRRPPEERSSKAGRKPRDAVVMFKALVLCELYNLSDEQFEYQLRDRLSFMRFLGLGLEDPVPDATTVWLYREQLAEAGLVDELFDAFDGHLKAQGWLAMGGQRLQEPRQRGPAAQAGPTLQGDRRVGPRQPGSRRRARRGEHRLRCLGGQRLLIGGDGTAPRRPKAAKPSSKLEDRGLESRIHRKAHRNRPLTECEKRGNKTRSKVRARVEHVFGAQTNDMGGRLARSIGIARAKARIGLKNLAYNMRRAVQLDGLAAARDPT